jgi:long-subunit fatty acid transport protein
MVLLSLQIFRHHLVGTFPASTSFTGKLNLPSVISTGISFQYKFNESNSLTVLYDFNYTGWSTYDTLAFDFANEDTPDSKQLKRGLTHQHIVLELNML